MTDKEKLDYLTYIYSKLIEKEPVDGSKAKSLRDSIYRGDYRKYNDEKFNKLLDHYLGDSHRDLDTSVGTIKNWLRNKKIDIINS